MLSRTVRVSIEAEQRGIDARSAQGAAMRLAIERGEHDADPPLGLRAVGVLGIGSEGAVVHCNTAATGQTLEVVVKAVVGREGQSSRTARRWYLNEANLARFLVS